MTASEGQTTYQGPTFLADWVDRHFIEGDGLRLRERLRGLVDDDPNDDSATAD